MGRGTQVQVALAAVVGFLFVELGTRTAISAASVGGAFVAAAVLTGPAAPLGGVAGLVIHDAFHGVIGYWTVATAVWILTFAGVVAWLVVGGVNATAFAAWLVLVLGAQPFYTAVMSYLPGVAVAVGLSVVGLVAVGTAERVKRLPDTHNRCARAEDGRPHRREVVTATLQPLCAFIDDPDTPHRWTCSVGETARWVYVFTAGGRTVVYE
ncbi:hypothetical protein [Haloarcula rubripromontorii]|uniref:hypothetical protein n=1 Tax=Haloarcula rubripromontorii TaxID=1705562 RepID=UPI00197F7B1D|nr:hypothetical protein [Haloarcula rubripromontorii]